MSTPTEDKMKALNDIKASFAPQIDQALLNLLTVLEQVEKTAAEIETDACIATAKNCKLIGPVPIGPLYGAGWSAAIDFVVSCLNKRKTESGV